MKRKNQDKRKNTILLISILLTIILVILGAIIYSSGKSKGYEKRDLELEQERLKTEKENSRLVSWENDLVKRENDLNQTIFNITDYQEKKKEVQDLKEKLDEPSKFDFIIPLYYNHFEIQWIIFSVTLIFPITLVLSQIFIQNKKLKIITNWFLISLLLFLFIIWGIE